MTRPKILIVDDEPFNVDYLEQELEEADCDILTASNGQEALDLVAACEPDLVLLDIMMPVMDGFEVLVRLKAHEATRDIPIIVISASSSLQSVVKGIQLGAEDYLPKPFEPVLLHARISASLERKRLRDVERQYLRSMERELDIAREIQLGFLPSALPWAPGWEIAVSFEAAHEVAGDFYDAFELPSGNIVCVVGDVCDKGVGAALFMTLFRSLIRAAATTDVFYGATGGRSLAADERLQHVISFTNHYIAETHGGTSMFASVFIGLLDRFRGTLTYVNGGNEAPWLRRHTGETMELRPTGPVVGVMAEARYLVKEVAMQAGDMLLAFTDGAPDALNTERTCYGRDRLLRVVNHATGSAHALLHDVESELRLFTTGADQFDDITLLAVKRTAST